MNKISSTKWGGRRLSSQVF